MTGRKRTVLAAPAFWIGLVVVGAAPYWMGPYWVDISTATLFYVGLSLAWNLVGGIGGQLSLAHSLFVAMGAHFANALAVQSGINIWAAIGIAAACAAVLGWLITWLAFRFRLPHLSFALVTLAFAEIGMLVVLGTDYLGGASGLQLTRATPGLLNLQFQSPRTYFWAMLVAALAAFVANVWTLRSKLGYYLRAIRDDEPAAQSMGIDVLRYQASAMAISAALTAIVATVYSRYQMYVDPYFFGSPLVVVEIVLFATIGGLGTLWGPVIGAGVLVPLGSLMRAKLGDVAPGLHYIVYGCLIVAVIMAMPDGLLGGFRSLFAWLRRRVTTT